MRKHTMLDFVLINKDGLVSKLKGNLGCSDQKMMEFKILSIQEGMQQACFKRADLEIFRELLGQSDMG